MDSLPKTCLIDIDGTLCVHDLATIVGMGEMILLPGTLQKLAEWRAKDYKLILTTGRDPQNRADTVRQLQNAGVIYDQLVMGVGRGMRVLINDQKPDMAVTDMAVTAKAYNLVRNAGLGEVEE